MGYYPRHINYFGLVISDEIAETLNLDGISSNEDIDDIPEEDIFEIMLTYKTPFGIELVGEFDGADSRIDPFKWVLYFRKYTYFKTHNITGDVLKSPTQSEIDEMKAFCDKHNIPWSEPVREELSYIE